jgi:hypothetical protein
MGWLMRGDEVEFIVTGAQPYGILVETVDGERGWVEDDAIAEGPVLPRSDWPQPGERLRGLVLGYTRDGRIRACLRAVDGHASPDSWPRAR